MSSTLDWRTKLTARTIIDRMGYSYSFETLLRKFKSCDYPRTRIEGEFNLWHYVEAMLICTDPNALTVLREKEAAIIISLEGDIAYLNNEGVPVNSAAVTGTKDAILFLKQLIGLAMRPSQP